ncbi:MAG TPA: hypothetical protein VL294_05925 [Pseudolysinimonas sp.]|jgi:hypothetical protein|nr:hypothetical protein [Pseudolysinimonas sp.]
MRRVAVVALAALVATSALTGCGRIDAGTGAAPATSASTPAATDPVDLGDVLADLDAAGDALDAADGDAGAGDDAARTDDAP